MAILTSFVLACAVCGAAEQTLPTSGNEVPFEGRKRGTVELRAASFETNDHALRVVELRVQPGVAMAITPATILGAEVPLLRRSLSLSGSSDAPASGTSSSAMPLPPRVSSDGASASTSASASAMSVGDVELRATHTAYRSAPALVVRRLTVSAGLKLPTAPLERDPNGHLVTPDLQPGCGAIVPIVGISHTWTARLWSVSTGVSILFPVSVRDGAHPGDSLRASTSLQLQPTRILATRLGVYGRLDGTGELDGEVVKRSGGGTVFAAPEIVLMPAQDLVISAGASFPVIQGMRAYHATAPVLLASVGMDF